MLRETFNRNRMGKCLEVHKTIINHCIATKRFECRVVADEDINGKTLDDVAKMYFDVGVGANLVPLPFLDMLVVFKMLTDHFQRRSKWNGNTEKYIVKTEFTDDEAFALLMDIHKKIGVEAKKPENN